MCDMEMIPRPGRSLLRRDVAERQRGEDRHSHEQGLPQVWQDAVLVVVALDPLEVAQGLLYQEHRVGLSHDDLQGHDAHEIQHGLHSVDTDDDPGQAGAELPDAVHFLRMPWLGGIKHRAEECQLKKCPSRLRTCSRSFPASCQSFSK